MIRFQNGSISESGSIVIHLRTRYVLGSLYFHILIIFNVFVFKNTTVLLYFYLIFNSNNDNNNNKLIIKKCCWQGQNTHIIFAWMSQQQLYYTSSYEIICLSYPSWNRNCKITFGVNSATLLLIYACDWTAESTLTCNVLSTVLQYKKSRVKWSGTSVLPDSTQEDHEESCFIRFLYCPLRFGVVP